MTAADGARSGACGTADYVHVRRLTGADAAATVDPLLEQYVPWVVEQIVDVLGVRFDDPATVVEHHQRSFRDELPHLLHGRGRLLVADHGADPVGMVALQPIDATTAEVKRMYVRADGRGRGVGRALLERLLAEADGEGFEVVRLETLPFMTAAQALYRSLGFRVVEPYAGSQSVGSGIGAFAVFMVRRRVGGEGTR